LYNEQGLAKGAEFRDAEGKLLGHIVRKFDAEGRIVAEEQFADAPHDFVLPEEIRSNLNPGQIKAVGAFAASVENRANSYSYDAQGRALPQVGLLKFCDGDIESGAELVFEAAQHLPLIFQRMRPFDAEFER